MFRYTASILRYYFVYIAIVLAVVHLSAQPEVVGPQLPAPPPTEAPKPVVQDPAPIQPSVGLPPTGNYIIIPEDKAPPRRKKTSTTTSSIDTVAPVAFATLSDTDTAAANLVASGSRNPFDFTFRTPLSNGTAEDINAIIATSPTGNPFDVAQATQRPTPSAAAQKAKEPVRRIWKPLNPADGKNTLFAVVVGMLVFLALGLSLNRGILKTLYQAMLYDNVLKTTFKDRTPAQIFPYYLLFMVFIVNAGIFGYLYSLHHRVPIAGSHTQAIGLCILTATVFFGGKQFILWVLGNIFPVEKEVSYYRFIVLIFCIVSGIILALANFFAAYASPDWSKYVFISTGITIGLLFILRLLRSLFVALPFIASYFFHFSLYLCAVEIAPVLMIVKYIRNYTGS